MIRKLAFIALGGAALALSSCIQSENITTVNPDGSGKLTINATLDLGPMGALLQQAGGAGGDAKPKDDTGKEMLLGLLSQTEGVDVWSEAKTATGADGKIKVTATGYFKDITKLKAGSPLTSMSDKLGDKAPGGDFPSIANIKSSKDGDGNWVLEMPLTPEGKKKEKDEDAPKPKKLTEDEIKGKIEEQRMQMAMAKTIGESMMGGMKITETLVVGGTIVDPGFFTKASDNSVKLEFTFGKMFGAMEKLINDDDFARKAVQLGGSNPFEAISSGDPDSKDLGEKMMQAIIGNKGKPRVLIKPGAPVFDYAAESAKAKAGQTPELLDLLKKAKEKADATKEEAPKKKAA